jgi:transposase-like protein
MEDGKKRKTYDKQLRLDAVLMVTRGGRKVPEVAEELGIDANTLYGWRRELQAAGEDAFLGKGNVTAQEAEIRELRRKLKEAEEEREILREALGYMPAGRHASRGARSEVSVR